MFGSYLLTVRCGGIEKDPDWQFTEGVDADEMVSHAVVEEW